MLPQGQTVHVDAGGVVAGAFVVAGAWVMVLGAAVVVAGRGYPG